MRLWNACRGRVFGKKRGEVRVFGWRRALMALQLDIARAAQTAGLAVRGLSRMVATPTAASMLEQARRTMR